MKRIKKEVQPHWRPNFVNSGDLPDIKVIRTDFIINILAVLLVVIVGSFTFQKEYRAYTLGKTIAGMEKEVRIAEPEDKASLNLSQEFRKLADNVVELEKFYLTPIFAHDFLANMAEIRPEELIFKQISFSEKVGEKKKVIYAVNIGGDVRSLTILDEFKGVLSDSEMFEVEGYELKIDESMKGRDPKTGIFPYTLNITLSPSEKGGKS